MPSAAGLSDGALGVLTRLCSSPSHFTSNSPCISSIPTLSSSFSSSVISDCSISGKISCFPSLTSPTVYIPHSGSLLSKPRALLQFPPFLPSGASWLINVIIPLSSPSIFSCSPDSLVSLSIISHFILMLLDTLLINLSYKSFDAFHSAPSHTSSLHASSNVAHPLSFTALFSSYLLTRCRSSSSPPHCLISPITSCVIMAFADTHPSPPCSFDAQNVIPGTEAPVLHAWRYARIHAFSKSCNSVSDQPAIAAEYLNTGITATCTTQCICDGEY